MLLINMRRFESAQHHEATKLCTDVGFSLDNRWGLRTCADSSSRYNHARAYAQCRSAVAGEMPSARAASSAVNPVKYRSFTSSALSGYIAASLVSASSKSNSPDWSSADVLATSSNSTRTNSPPCLRRAAAPCSLNQNATHSFCSGSKKCPRLSQPSELAGPTRRT